MEIKDLKPRQGNVDVVVDIILIGDVREFQKFGKPGKVANATVKDETGEVKLTLWNEQIDQVKAGDKVHITNGYVNEFQGEMQLTTGKFGKMEIVDGDEKPADEGQHVLTDDEKTEEETSEETSEEDPLDQEPTKDELDPTDEETVKEEIITEDEKTEDDDLDELKEKPAAEEEMTDDEIESDKEEEALKDQKDLG